MQRDGEVIYRTVCQGCHTAAAQGAVGAGTYPALANDPKLAAAGYPVTARRACRRSAHCSISRLGALAQYPFNALALATDAGVETVAEVFVRINGQGAKLNQADFGPPDEVRISREVIAAYLGEQR
jgi:mono/diheme cytochrome c family protein